MESHDLCDAAYYLMIQQGLHSEDENKVIDQINSKFADLAYEEETGMPAITRWLAPADGAL